MNNERIITQEQLEEIHNKYGTLSAFIVTYDLNMAIIDKIIEKMSNYKIAFIYPNGIPKEVICTHIRGYLFNEKGRQSEFFKETTILGGAYDELHLLKCQYIKNKVELEGELGKKFSEKYRQQKFEELNDLKRNITDLMALFQNPAPVTIEDVTQFENDKDKLISKLNEIYIDLKVQYNKL